MGEGDVNGLAVGDDPGGCAAADGAVVVIGDLRAEPEPGDYRWMLAVGEVVGPERAALV